MEITNTHLLLMINFLHFLSSGVLMPLIGRQITKYGGTPILVGAMQSVVYICQKLSKNFVELFEIGKQFIIATSLHLCFFYSVSMIFVTAWWYVCAMRILYALTTQVFPYSKDFITKTYPRQERTKICNLLGFMKVAGLCAGSITGGCLFHWYRNFTLNATVASLTALLSVFLVYFVDTRELNMYSSSSHLFVIKNICYKHYKNLKETELKEKWHDVMLKTAYIITFALYFTRFAFILAYNYRVTTMVIGFTRAYYHIVVFICACLIPFVRQQFEDGEALLENAMFFAVVSLFAVFYAPSLWCYLLCYIPLLFSYQLANSLLDEDALQLKDDMKVYLATDTIATLIAASTPFVFAVMSETFGKPLTKLLSLIPAIYLTFLLNQRFLKTKIKEMAAEEVEEDKESVEIKEPDDETIEKE